MKEILKRQSIKRPKFFPKEVEAISQEQLQQSIRYSYTSQKLWGEHLNLYTDLFSEASKVEQRAKTHSLAVMCVNLRYKYGCTFHRIYTAVLTEISNSDIELSSEILSLKSKCDFIDSLFEV
jgi:hypothetical protein